MATYFDIFGQQVQYLSSDPSPSAEGQVWFNSTTSVAKVVGFNPGSWSTGGVYPVSYNGMSNGGSTPDGVVFEVERDQSLLTQTNQLHITAQVGQELQQFRLHIL